MLANQSVSAQLKDQTSIEIDWLGLSWARSFLNDDKQTVAPKTAQDILQIGDVIMVAPTELAIA